MKNSYQVIRRIPKIKKRKLSRVKVLNKKRISRQKTLKNGLREFPILNKARVLVRKPYPRSFSSLRLPVSLKILSQREKYLLDNKSLTDQHYHDKKSAFNSNSKGDFGKSEKKASKDVKIDHLLNPELKNYLEPITNLNGMVIEDGFSQYQIYSDSQNDLQSPCLSQDLPLYTLLDNYMIPSTSNEQSDSVLLNYSEIYPAGTSKPPNNHLNTSIHNSINNLFRTKAKTSSINFLNKATFQTASCLDAQLQSDDVSTISSTTFSTFSTLN
ncbi:hypothetical protein AYI68_g8050 [Smittium mucronatum]|uniref:Uncharacterized protein n=1 Tax=Smittium mucronatum TaxID=133383 RepID=A0A1R0GM05_9FUNG|nr:hypothetical protein AYI68_g8050 [Smittium mucronatum]